jgi:hypothetical protein
MLTSYKAIDKCKEIIRCHNTPFIISGAAREIGA